MDLRFGNPVIQLDIWLAQFAQNDYNLARLADFD